MTKADLVEKIAAKANLTKAAAERALNAFLASVEDALVKEISKAGIVRRKTHPKK